MFKSVIALLLLATVSVAQKIEPAAKPNVPPALAAAVQDHGFHVFDKDGPALVSLWPAKSVSTTKKDVEGASYPQFDVASFLGVISFDDDAKDFRGQTIPKGTYTLRYALLPDDGNHMGVAPNRDFLLLMPLAADPDPSGTFTAKQLYRASAKVNGGTHPTVLSLPADDAKPGSVTTSSEGYVVLHFSLPASGGELPIALIVKGMAQQ